MFEVYCHTHVASQKRYVGITKNGMRVRWLRHCSAARNRGSSQRYFHAAIRKHGPESFGHEVLETCDTLDAANEAEQWWIGHFGSNDPVLGYNLDGGGNARGVGEETRARLSEAGRKRAAKMTPEERRRAYGHRDEEWASLAVVQEAIRDMSRAAYDRQRVSMGNFPPGGRFPRIYGCTYNEARVGSRGDVRVQYLTADEIGPKIQGLTKDRYQRTRHSLGPQYPDATLFPDVYGMTFAEVRDGVRGCGRAYMSESDAQKHIQGWTYPAAKKLYTDYGGMMPHPDSFQKVYGKSFTEVRDGVKADGRFVPGHNRHPLAQTRAQ